jgi:hypothetical protein
MNISLGQLYPDVEAVREELSRYQFMENTGDDFIVYRSPGLQCELDEQSLLHYPQLVKCARWALDQIKKIRLSANEPVDIDGVAVEINKIELKQDIRVFSS